MMIKYLAEFKILTAYFDMCQVCLLSGQNLQVTFSKVYWTGICVSGTLFPYFGITSFLVVDCQVTQRMFLLHAW